MKKLRRFMATLLLTTSLASVTAGFSVQAGDDEPNSPIPVIVIHSIRPIDLSK